MPSSVQRFQPALLSAEVVRQLTRLQNSKTISRFWNRDISLWPTYRADGKFTSKVLGWLDLADHLEASSKLVSHLGQSLEAEGFTDVVFLAVSSSSLAAELVASLGLRTRGAKFHILNRVEPSGINALIGQLDLKRTLFLVATKSGKNLEMHALLLYLLARTRAAGLVFPSMNFVAITEEDSYLSALARENHFRAVLTEPSGFRGRFSGVVHYGHLLSGLCEMDIHRIVAGVREMRERCTLENSPEQNPAAHLAAFLAAIAQTGFHRLFFRTSPQFHPFAERIAHLVGSSTCKEEKGIVPFLENLPPNELPPGCSLCEIHVNTGEVSSLPPEIPAISIQIGGVENIAAEIFKWEIATGLACSLLEVNPFEDPDFGKSRRFAGAYLEQITLRKAPETPRPRLVEGQLSLYVEGELRHEISSLSLEQALASFLSLVTPEGFIFLQCFGWNLPWVKDCGRSLAPLIASHLGVPTEFVDGPWYLHIHGQCYKGGPRGGLAFMITCDPLERLDVPGAGYTLGDLSLALALGDFDAMVLRRRPAIRVHLSGSPDVALAELGSVTAKALKLARRHN